LASVGARQSALVKARFTLYGDAKPPCGGKFRRASGHKPGALTRAARRYAQGSAENARGLCEIKFLTGAASFYSFNFTKKL
jgi:hypothetical protein